MTTTGPAPDTNGVKPVWTYAYELKRPLPRAELATISKVLTRAHRDAQLTSSTWSGRLVAEEVITHILVVSDDSGFDKEISQQLETELLRLRAEYVRTLPLAVTK